MDHLQLTEDVISVDSIMKLVSSEKCGAVSMFVGTTRNNFEGKKVKNLEYEAYEPMALKVMKNLCTDIRNKWDQIENIAIYHRLGTVPVLEASVVIAISSPHRIESLAAVQYCIENLKAIDTEDNVKLKNQNDSDNIADPHSVQIIASHDEMRLRIEKYTKWKREQNDLNNIHDFIDHTSSFDDGHTSADTNTTCARVDAVLLKSKDSKSHLKVMRTENEWGPQTKIDDPKSLLSNDAISRDKSGIEERLFNVEQHLNVAKPISSDIYSRLKKIEDKILEIESISPEYAKYWSRKDPSSSGCELESDEIPAKKMKFSSEDIWKKIKMIKKS